MTTNIFPPGWDDERVRRVVAHYERQTEDDAVTEDEAAFDEPKETVIQIPVELLPAVRALLARRPAG